jgi:hypothetical protein
MSHVFISYAHQDKRSADAFIRELEKGKGKWYLASQSLLPGMPYREEIDKALRDANSVIVILTPWSNKSPYVIYEWSFALGAGKRVIPVMLKKIARAKLHPRLEAMQYLDFTKTRRWGKLVTMINPEKHPLPEIRAGLKPLLIPVSLDFGSSQTQVSVPEAPSTPAAPAILARFELDKNAPVKLGESYKIWISMKNAPAGTRRVYYKILDESFTEPSFSVDSSHSDFEDYITSYGDVPITAKGKGKQGDWKVRTTLAEALRQFYGNKTTPKIRKALLDIANN